MTELETSNAPARMHRVAIVGRPNVGKSTLLNRMCNSRVSIVEPTSGVTRDRVAVAARIPVESTESGERWVEVVDTGGIGIVDRHDLEEDVESQVALAVEGADLILFLVDAREGITPLDHEVARRLRGSTTPVLLVANKVEGTEPKWVVDEFRRLGMPEGPIAISAQNGTGLEEFYDRVDRLLPAEGATVDAPADPVLKIAVVGQRNAGKSTLINALAGEDRMIVSEIPGTTRDAVDVRFERDGRTFVAIDTAGLRKRSKLADAIEYYSDARSHRTIRRADVVVHLFDVSQPMSSIDHKLSSYIVDHHKPVILAANKWDLVRGEHERREFVKYVRNELPGLAWAPMKFLTAKEGGGVFGLVDVAEELLEEARKRVGTGELNRVLARATEARSPTKDGARVRVLYATQADTTPPTFILFVNDKRLISKAYLRYLQNRLREELPFKRVPIRIALRDRRSNPEDHR